MHEKLQSMQQRENTGIFWSEPFMAVSTHINEV